jgi:hypothetical protein
MELMYEGISILSNLNFERESYREKVQTKDALLLKSYLKKGIFCLWHDVPYEHEHVCAWVTRDVVRESGVIEKYSRTRLRDRLFKSCKVDLRYI